MHTPTTERPGWRWKAGCLLATALLVGGLVFAIRMLPLWTWGAAVVLIIAWAVWADRGNGGAGVRLRSLAARLAREQAAWIVCADVRRGGSGPGWEIDVVLAPGGGLVRHGPRSVGRRAAPKTERKLSSAEVALARHALDALDLWSLRDRVRRGRSGGYLIVALADGRRRHAFRCMPPDGAELEVVRALEGLADRTGAADA